MDEQRRGSRIRKRLACEITANGRRVDGCVRDVSAAGLSVHADLECSEGDAVHLRIEPARGAPVEVDAIVWHVRRVRQRREGTTTTVFGLVLSHVPAAWFDRIGAPRPDAGNERHGTRPARPAACAPRATDPETPPASASGPIAFLVRLKEVASCRTRVYRIEAISADHARAQAIAQAGDTWSVLEAVVL